MAGLIAHPPSVHANPWRADFPSLDQIVNGHKIAYLDSGASAQKPRIVLDAILKAYKDEYANIHRGLYQFSQKKTEEFEAVRIKVARFIGAATEESIVFTRNSTESINLVAQSWGRKNIQAGDEIIVTAMEHHANIVPWQLLAEQAGAIIKVIPIHNNGELDIESIKTLLSEKTKLVAFTHVSNALGTINPASEIVRIVRNYNSDIKILIDGSQSIVHMPVDVTKLDCDFFAFTGHKLYGPTGVGVLYGKPEVLAEMPPWQGGGDMIDVVRFTGTTYKNAPYRFEAGTPAIAEVIALGAAIDYVQAIGMATIQAYEQDVLAYAMHGLETVKNITIYGTAPEKAAIISFNMAGIHNSDVAMVLDQMGVAVRTGHHCCMPLMQHLGIDGTVRASCGLYTDYNDIDRFVAGLQKSHSLFG